MIKLYYNGDIITMKSKNDKPSAIVTQDDEIIYVGDYEAARNIYREAEFVNLEGKTIMPGFIDPHSHFFQTAQSINMCDLSEAISFTDIVDILSSYKEEHKEAKIIFASGYDHNFLKEQMHPDKAVLDSVSMTIPIYISHVSGHMGVANSALLKMAGITDETKDPEGGRFGRYNDGKLNGYIEEIPALMQILAPAMEFIKTDMPSQIKKAQQLYFKYGVTTVQEGAASKQAAIGLATLARNRLIDIDIVTYIMDEDYAETASLMKDYTLGNYVNHIKIGGSKIILDGSPQGKSAWLSKPYKNEKEYCGYASHDLDYVVNACMKAIKGKYQILAHCNGDAASEQFIQAYLEAMKKEGTDNGIRPVMIHCQTVRDDQLDRMADIRMIPSIFVGHIYFWGDVHKKNLGINRAERISPVKSALDRGLIYNFHQDTPVTKPDMLHSVWCAVNRITRNGDLLGKDQCIDAYDALKGITINAAYEYNEENIKGTLETGKKADMVILSDNPLKINPVEIKNIQVVTTIKNGKVVFN
ncbi:amidohydrolase [Agathobacter sp.]